MTDPERKRNADPEVVTPLQRQVLKIVGAAEQAYGPVGLRLMGGTALAGYYLHHRQSEDLDLFGGPPMNARDFGLFVRARLEAEGFTVDTDERYPLNQGFARFVVAGGDHPPVQIDFGRESPFMLEPAITTAEGIMVGSFRDLCAGKLSAASGRFASRDFIDLHAILWRPRRDGGEVDEDTIRRRMTELLRDVRATDPGLTPPIIADGLGRALGQALVAGFPLRLLHSYTEAAVQRTLRTARAVCADATGDEWMKLEQSE